MYHSCCNPLFPSGDPRRLCTACHDEAVKEGNDHDWLKRGEECGLCEFRQSKERSIEAIITILMNRIRRDIKPPIIPTTCQCSLYDRDYLTDKHGNKWCTGCGNYKGHITDHK